MSLYSTQHSIFLFIDTATSYIYSLSLHDALPIYRLPFASIESCLGIERQQFPESRIPQPLCRMLVPGRTRQPDRKSTRLNSSHRCISYAVFCLKKKMKKKDALRTASGMRSEYNTS